MNEKELDIYTENGQLSDEKIKACIPQLGLLGMVKYLKEKEHIDLKTAKEIVDRACGGKITDEEEYDIYTEDGQLSDEKIKAWVAQHHAKLSLVKYIKDKENLDLKTAKEIVDKACGNESSTSGCLLTATLIVGAIAYLFF